MLNFIDKKNGSSDVIFDKGYRITRNNDRINFNTKFWNEQIGDVEGRGVKYAFDPSTNRVFIAVTNDSRWTQRTSKSSIFAEILDKYLSYEGRHNRYKLLTSPENGPGIYEVVVNETNPYVDSIRGGNGKALADWRAKQNENLSQEVEVEESQMYKEEEQSVTIDEIVEATDNIHIVGIAK